MAFVVAAVRWMVVLVDRCHWAWLVLATPFLLFPNPSRSPMLLVVPIVWLIGLIAGTAPVRRTSLNVALLLMFIMVLVSEWATYDLAFSLPKIAGMVLGIGIFFATVRVSESPRGWRLACAALLLMGIGLAGLGLLGTNFGSKFALLAPLASRLTPQLRGLPGVESGFSPNELAGALVWLAPLFITLTIVIARLHWHWSRLAGLMLFVATLFILGVLVLTQSRGGYLGLAGCFMLMQIFAVSHRWRRLGLVILLVGLVVGIGIVVVQPNSLEGLITGGNPSDTTDPVAVIESVNGRVEVWSRALYGIQDFPFTGMGMNTFRKVVTVLYPFFLISPDVDIAHAHNEFLQAGLDLGIPGLIAFVAIYLIAFWMLIQIWRGASQSSRGAGLRAVALGFGGGLVAHMVYGMTDAVALGAKPGFIFWMMLGLIAALYEQVRTGRVAEWQ